MSSLALFPKLHPTHIKQLKSALNHAPFFGSIYFHGDGNMYPEFVIIDGKKVKNQNSDDRMIFHNAHPANTPAEYRVLFDRTSRIPADLDELADMLMAAHQKELVDKVAEENVSGPQSMAFKVEDEPNVQAAPAQVAAVQEPPKEAPIPEPAIPAVFKTEGDAQAQPSTETAAAKTAKTVPATAGTETK